MEVLLLTTLFSVVFALFFLTLFLRERQVRRFGSVERDALMPLDDGDEFPAFRTDTRRAPLTHPAGTDRAPGGHAPAMSSENKDTRQECPPQH